MRTSAAMVRTRGWSTLLIMSAVGFTAWLLASEPSGGVALADSAKDCLVITPGDFNGSNTVTSNDVIILVNYVFKGVTPLSPCSAAGDVNCSGSVTSSDVIYLRGYIFKGGAAPCDLRKQPSRRVL